MKRLFAMLLALTLLLSACGGKPTPTEPSTEPSTEPTVLTEPTVSSEPTEPPATTEPTPTTEPVKQVLYRHPLTGAPLEAPWSGQIAAVMVNNIKDSMPQHGLTGADIIYEIEEESSITRNMALYTDLAAVEQIGSIRSTRTYFVSVAAAFDAYLIHCGTSKYAAGGRYNSSGYKLSNWKHIDQFYNASYFFRDSERWNSGKYAWEHTLFTTGELLTKALEGKANSTPAGGFGLKFAENASLSTGTDAKEIVITFKNKKTTTFVYDEGTGLYKRMQFGADSIDANNNQVLAVKNVIAIYTKQTGSSSGHQFYDTIGKGEGYAAMNGKIVPILWSRADVNSPYIYTLTDGTPLELDVGKTYIAVVGIRHAISYK